MNMDHNLFKYATSELSQDAFLCWLLSYAMEDGRNANVILHDCALAMLERMCRRDDEQRVIPTIVTRILKQYHHMDVVVCFVSNNGEAYHLIIEDKTWTNEHDDQLIRYMKALPEFLRKDFPGSEPDAAHVLGVYYKSSLQGDLIGVKQSNYALMLRPDILSVLESYKNRMSNAEKKSEIFMSYFEKLYSDEKAAEQYTESSPATWREPQIEKYFESIRSDLAERCGERMAWDYVNNPSGTFLALYSSGRGIKEENTNAACSVYLQLEFTARNDDKGIAGKGRFCVKLCVQPVEETKKLSSDERNSIAEKLLDRVLKRKEGKYTPNCYHFIKPSRLRAATYMTVGVHSLFDKDMPEMDHRSLTDEILRYCDHYTAFCQYLEKEGIS